MQSASIQAPLGSSLLLYSGVSAAPAPKPAKRVCRPALCCWWAGWGRLWLACSSHGSHSFISLVFFIRVTYDEIYHSIPKISCPASISRFVRLSPIGNHLLLMQCKLIAHPLKSLVDHTYSSVLRVSEATISLVFITYFCKCY